MLRCFLVFLNFLLLQGIDEDTYEVRKPTIYDKDNVHMLSKEIRSQYSKNLKIWTVYENAKTVFPGLFALSESEGKNLPNLLLNYILPKLSCAKKVSKRTLRKVYELNRILNETSCGYIYEPPYRRQILADGSETTTTLCVNPKETLPSDNNVIYLAKTCIQINTLQTRFPPIINEVVCGDTRCFGKEGVATQLKISMKFRSDDNNVGINRLAEWREYDGEIKSGCACNMMESSPLVNLITKD
nr:uncharacterized protein LOC124808850 [Hydra vulgaris]